MWREVGRVSLQDIAELSLEEQAGIRKRLQEQLGYILYNTADIRRN